MNGYISKRLFVVAAVLGAVAVFAMGFFVALGIRSVVAGPDSAPLAQAPNPGHSYDQIELPVGTWSGLDADTLDGLQSTEIHDADDYVSSAGYATTAGDADTLDGAHASALEESAEVDADIAAHASNPSAHHTKTTDASEIVSGTMAPERIAGTAWTSLNDGPGSGLDADTVDGLDVSQIHDADDYVSNAGDADTVDGLHASDIGGISSCWDARVPAYESGDSVCATGGGYCTSIRSSAGPFSCSLPHTVVNVWARCCK